MGREQLWPDRTELLDAEVMLYTLQVYFKVSPSAPVNLWSNSCLECNKKCDCQGYFLFFFSGTAAELLIMLSPLVLCLLQIFVDVINLSLQPLLPLLRRKVREIFCSRQLHAQITKTHIHTVNIFKGHAISLLKLTTRCHSSLSRLHPQRYDDKKQSSEWQINNVNRPCKSPHKWQMK